MAVFHDLTRQKDSGPRGPQLMFFGSVAVVFGAFALSWRMLPQDLVTPAVVTLLFALAAAVAIAARVSHRRFATTQLNYLDVAGALILIGIGLAALVEPEQMMRLVADDGGR